MLDMVNNELQLAAIPPESVASQRQPTYPHPATGVAHEAVSLPAPRSAARVTGPARASPGHELRPGGS